MHAAAHDHDAVLLCAQFSQEVAERVVDCPHKLTCLHLIQQFDLGAEVAGHWRGHHLIHVGVAQQVQGRRCRFRLLLQHVRKTHDVAYAAGETVDSCGRARPAPAASV